MREGFFRLAERLTGRLRGEEVLLCAFSGEESDFVRFNRSAIRQAGSVRQGYLSLDLFSGSRSASATFALSGDGGEDEARGALLLSHLREALPHIPEDPYAAYAEGARSGERCGERRLPEKDEAVAAILAAGEGRDLVGLYAAGGIFAGFANSLGQRNWFASYSFHFDWSFYLRADKAVKARYAGFAWEAAELDRRAAEAARRLDHLARPPRTIPPGRYRVFLSPAALGRLLSFAGYRAFGLQARRTKRTPLLQMDGAGGRRLHPSVHLAENTREGIAPDFQEQGFARPDRVPLIEAGALGEPLVSPRSEKEFGVPTNGASAGEAPESLDMAGGDLPAAEALRRLEPGVYVSDLWYLNYSDVPSCRITGLTRFATFWVEGGEIQAPLNVMRFDVSLFRVLGENLLGLTAEREFIPDGGTYGARSTGSVRAPGALVEDFAFTL